jgi:hypothetical protein
MLKVATFVVAALVSSVSTLVHNEFESRTYAQVHEYITNEHCKEEYIIKHRPACVHEDGTCHPVGTDNGCKDV